MTNETDAITHTRHSAIIIHRTHHEISFDTFWHEHVDGVTCHLRIFRMDWQSMKTDTDMKLSLRTLFALSYHLFLFFYIALSLFRSPSYLFLSHSLFKFSHCSFAHSFARSFATSLSFFFVFRLVSSLFFSYLFSLSLLFSILLSSNRSLSHFPYSRNIPFLFSICVFLTLSKFSTHMFAICQ